MATPSYHAFWPSPKWIQKRKEVVFRKYKRPCEGVRNVCFLPWLWGSRTQTLTLGMLTFKEAIQTCHAFCPCPKWVQKRKKFFSWSTRAPAKVPVNFICYLTSRNRNPNPNPKQADIQNGNTQLPCILPKSKMREEPKTVCFPYVQEALRRFP